MLRDLLVVGQVLGKNCLLLSLHTGLCHCLVTSWMCVCCTVKYAVGQCNLGRSGQLDS